MESSAAVETMEAIGASVGALAVFVDLATGNGPLKGGQISGDADPVRVQADAGVEGAGVDPLRDQADAAWMVWPNWRRWRPGSRP
jgi:hypothetical protein